MCLLRWRGVTVHDDLSPGRDRGRRTAAKARAAAVRRLLRRVPAAPVARAPAFVVDRAMPMMRAVVLREPGPVTNLEIRELPMPVPQPGWIRIRVKASTPRGLRPTDD